MGLTIKHTGRGKYQVLDGETVVASGLDKVHAQAIADGDAPAPKPEEPEAEPAEHAPQSEGSEPAGDGIPDRDENGLPLTEAQRRRIYEKRMETGRREENERFLAPYKAMVHRDFDEDTAAAVWRQIEPALQAGAEGVRRNLGRNMRVRAG